MTARMRVTKAAGPATSANTAPWYDGSGFAIVGYLSALAFQSNLPPSTITPPRLEP